MASLVDLEKLQRIFGRTGERVVLVLPLGEPYVLVSLDEYEALVAAGSGNAALQSRVIEKKVAQPSQKNTQSSPESIDPYAGALADDDQYFPEPLD